MGQVPLEHRAWYEKGLRDGVNQMDGAARRVLASAAEEVKELRSFCARIAGERNLPRWVTKRAEKLARKAEPEEKGAS